MGLFWVGLPVYILFAMAIGRYLAWRNTPRQLDRRYAHGPSLLDRYMDWRSYRKWRRQVRALTPTGPRSVPGVRR